MHRPWLSVVMPVFNGERYLAEALESVALQGQSDIELIVLDDGSTDRSAEILQRWESRLPMRIERPPRCGNWVAVTNRGLEMGRGEFACFLHQDDVWRRDRLRVLRRMIEEVPTTDFLMHATGYIDRRGVPLGRYRPPFRESDQDLPAPEVVRPFLIQNVLSIPSALFRRQVALEGGGLDERLWYSADWDLWLRLAARGRARCVARVLAGYRLHPHTQTSLRSGDLAEFRRQHEMVFDKHFPAWRAALPDAEQIAARARFSIDVNTALAALASRQKPGWTKLAGSFAALGVGGAWSYLRDSRILERMSARVRGRLWASAPTPQRQDGPA
jgi:glycosyltransferase involved in cell wall biosynthesis